MLSRIHFLHEILLNLLISCRKNKVSYHVFLLLLLVHEVYIENQEPRIEKSDWSIQISYALNTVNTLLCPCYITLPCDQVRPERRFRRGYLHAGLGALSDVLEDGRSSDVGG